MFILRFDVESAYALNPSIESDENWQIWLEETLASVEQITRVLKRYDALATFCIVGKVLERAGEDLADLLKDNPLFDIASHTYSHMGISSTEPNVLRQFNTELEQTSDLILRYFGARPIGFCAPGGFYKGLQGHPKQLGILWEQGYQFIITDGVGPPEQPMPAPFTQPYWYAEEGFPELFEIPVTGWHCNLLFNTGHQSDDWETRSRICGRNGSGEVARNDRRGVSGTKKGVSVCHRAQSRLFAGDASVVGVPL